MFLSFFPLLLVALGLVRSSARLSAVATEMLRRLQAILPPDSRPLVLQYLIQRGGNPWKWILIGTGAGLLVGTQAMTGLMEGFRIVYRERERPRFWRQHARALLMLCLTIGPWIGAAILTVFGKQVRAWMIHQFGLPRLFHGLWLLVYEGLALVLATLVLAVVYRVGRPGCGSWNQVVPGGLVATLLWWVVTLAFGFYVRHMPYRLVYGGLAAVIGLMVWMYLSALMVLIGAAYNAAASARSPDSGV
jgi:membrane protein